MSLYSYHDLGYLHVLLVGCFAGQLPKAGMAEKKRLRHQQERKTVHLHHFLVLLIGSYSYTSGMHCLC